MKNVVGFTLMSLIKLLSQIFYRFEVKWLDGSVQRPWKEIKLIVFLNHTSLYEPVFFSQAPSLFLWRIAKYAVIPGADITINRPVVGRFFKWIAPGLISISRKKDSSWRFFMESIDDESIVLILPEGRMKRRDGLDKDGKAMSVRGGIAEILSYMDQGKALFVYSGGLHHIQAPGQKLPKIFKKIKVNLEMVDIKHYKSTFESLKENTKQYRLAVMADLNERLNNKIPK